jgi:hypothetical protein
LDGDIVDCFYEYSFVNTCLPRGRLYLMQV